MEAKVSPRLQRLIDSGLLDRLPVTFGAFLLRPGEGVGPSIPRGAGLLRAPVWTFGPHGSGSGGGTVRASAPPGAGDGCERAGVAEAAVHFGPGGFPQSQRALRGVAQSSGRYFCASRSGPRRRDRAKGTSAAGGGAVPRGVACGTRPHVDAAERPESIRWMERSQLRHLSTAWPVNTRRRKRSRRTTRG